MTRTVQLPNGEAIDDRRNSGNGLSKLVWTVMVSACGVIFIGFFAWMSTMQQGLALANTITLAYGQRLSVVETNATAMNVRLGRIEDKLDRLMGRFDPKP